jgi:transcriptional regulator with XRE-family HTH domain
MRNTFPSALAQLMEQRNISVAEIAEAVSVEHQTVQHWLAGAYPGRQSLERLCIYFAVTEKEFMHGGPGFERGRLQMAELLAEVAVERTQANLSADKKAKIVALLYHRLATDDATQPNEIAQIDGVSV